MCIYMFLLACMFITFVQVPTEAKRGHELLWN